MTSESAIAHEINKIEQQLKDELLIEHVKATLNGTRYTLEGVISGSHTQLFDTFSMPSPHITKL